MAMNQYMKIVDDTISASKLLGIKYGIAFIDLKESKNTFFHHESEIFEVGSVIKICILVEVLTRFQNKTIDLDERVELLESKKCVGSGILGGLRQGANLTIYDYLKLMIIISDNTSTNYLLDIIGVESVNERMQSIGFNDLKLLRRIPMRSKTELNYEYSDSFINFRFSEASALSLAKLYQQLYEEKLFSHETTLIALEILSEQKAIGRIPLFFSGRFEINEGEKWEGKNGTFRNISNTDSYSYLYSLLKVPISIYSLPLGTLNDCLSDSGILTTSKSSYSIVILAKGVSYKEDDGMQKANYFIGTIAYNLVNYFEKSSVS